jgi:hypothetical protein
VAQTQISTEVNAHVCMRGGWCHLHLQSPRSFCPPVFLPSIPALASLFLLQLLPAAFFLLQLLSAAYYLRHCRPSPSFSKPSGDVSLRSTACANDRLALESPAPKPLQLRRAPVLPQKIAERATRLKRASQASGAYRASLLPCHLPRPTVPAVWVHRASPVNLSYDE